jgi:hypothetical protein
MNKVFFCSALLLALSTTINAQLSVVKMVGKNADQYKLGYCLFTFFDFPVTEEGNRSIRLELMDLAMFPGKDGNFFTTENMRSYLSIKLGYKYIFSESRTGIYVEPSAGWCRVVDYLEGMDEAAYGDGLALAFETGYSLEVGQKGHVLNFGLKYENDRGGSKISSVGFRVSYAFNMFSKRGY